MTALYDTLFEVSNDIRHKILKELAKGDRTMSSLSEYLGISLTEASRHLSRLSEANLIEKNVDGRFSISLFGNIVLRQLKSLEFVSDHIEYFKTHDLSRLPSRFVDRLYELEMSQPNYLKRANIMLVANNVARIGLESESYVLSLVDEEIMELVLYTSPDENTRNFFNEAANRGVSFKSLFPDTFDPKKVPEDALQMYKSVIKSGNVEYRAVSKVGLFLHMSEKEVTILSFPDKNGNFDYLGFEAFDSTSLNWCKEVFEYYWKRSKPLSLF